MVVLIQTYIFVQNWTWMIHICVWLSISFTFLILYIESTDVGWFFAPMQYGVFPEALSMPSFYFVVLLACGLSVVPTLMFKSLQWQFFPQDWQIFRERESLGETTPIPAPGKQVASDSVV
eukprot:TRINITY_DN1648_c0_g1_i2.p1 TRINITY_DN1648_c0_g1~~TRINITY_DN1648_c0_g1_i2.p1  ORF type:complete len:120 (-),score=7.90 TRINITY_DN1648_c0_g1_i2:49-408(-)